MQLPCFAGQGSSRPYIVQIPPHSLVFGYSSFLTTILVSVLHLEAKKDLDPQLLQNFSYSTTFSVCLTVETTAATGYVDAIPSCGSMGLLTNVQSHPDANKAVAMEEVVTVMV
jgi:hypothetical protein